jgi:hypothetical protein
MPGTLQQGEHGAEGILDYDAIPQDNRRERRHRHPVSLADRFRPPSRLICPVWATRSAW